LKKYIAVIDPSESKGVWGNSVPPAGSKGGALGQGLGRKPQGELH